MNGPDLAQLELDGFCLAPAVLEEEMLGPLRVAMDQLVATGGAVRATSHNARRLLECCPLVAELADSPALRQLVDPVLGPRAFAVRGLLFDKTDSANWQVGWHQDLMIPVTARIEAPGFTAWSIKQGVPHVSPPAKVLQGMLTVRVHLDDCPADNGPLEVLPGTHRLGMVPEAKIRSAIEGRPQHVCTAQAGDVLLMRPLLMHRSSPSQQTSHRRVVHVEFASQDLPGGLAWHRPAAGGVS